MVWGLGSGDSSMESREYDCDVSSVLEEAKFLGNGSSGEGETEDDNWEVG